MAQDREVQVHLLPELVPAGRLAGGLAVVIDVLRATTTIIHALAAGCTCVRPCAEIEEARQVAGQMRAGRVLLGGERGGKPLPGFDVGNSPREYTPRLCRGITLVLIAVFLPMAFFPGSVGIIYRQFSVTMVAAVGFSALMALSLTPALCATLLKPIPAGSAATASERAALSRTRLLVAASASSPKTRCLNVS